MANIKTTTSTRLPYMNPSIIRYLFLLETSPLNKAKEKKIVARSSTIPSTLVGTKLWVSNGIAWRQKTVSPWLVGFKFGEFSLTRKPALYKAKQKKKRKKNNNSTQLKYETWMNFGKAFVTNLVSPLGISLTFNFRTRLLCSRDDARSDESVRHGSLWYHF